MCAISRQRAEGAKKHGERTECAIKNVMRRIGDAHAARVLVRARVANWRQVGDASGELDADRNTAAAAVTLLVAVTTASSLYEQACATGRRRELAEVTREHALASTTRRAHTNTMTRSSVYRSTSSSPPPPLPPPPPPPPPAAPTCTRIKAPTAIRHTFNCQLVNNAHQHEVAAWCSALCSRSPKRACVSVAV